MATFGERVRESREREGLKPGGLASDKRLDVSEAAVRMWETNKTIPSIETLLKLADIFNCSTDYLLGKSEYRNEVEIKRLDGMAAEVSDALDKLPLYLREKVNVSIQAITECYNRFHSIEEEAATSCIDYLYKIATRFNTASVRLSYHPVDETTRTVYELQTMRDRDTCRAELDSHYETILNIIKESEGTNNG